MNVSGDAAFAGELAPKMKTPTAEAAGDVTYVSKPGRTGKRDAGQRDREHVKELTRFG